MPVPTQIVMPSLRKFAAEIETVATAWRSPATTALPWSVRGRPGEEGGSAQGYFVEYEALLGFAKPSVSPGLVPVAAQEKIVSDLAYDLGLPVPPVLLWDRGDRNDKLFRCQIRLVSTSPHQSWGADRVRHGDRLGGASRDATCGRFRHPCWPRSTIQGDSLMAEWTS